MAFIHFSCTKLTLKAIGTSTNIFVDAVLAGGSILARVAGTLIHRYITVFIITPIGAQTKVTIDAIITGGFRYARVAGTFINVGLTILACLGKKVMALSYQWTPPIAQA